MKVYGSDKSTHTAIKRFILPLLIAVFYCPENDAAKLALIVGISNYAKYMQPQSTWNNIHGTNDARILGKALQHQGFSVKQLTDNRATARNIRKALTQMAMKTKAGDIVYIHFSCHGQPVEDTDGDEPDGWDESIVAYDAARRFLPNVYRGENHIIDDELNRYISAIRRKAGKSGFVYVVIDACHAGDSSRGEDRGEDDDDKIFVRGTADGFSSSGKKFLPRLDKRANITLSRESGTSGACYIEACRSYQNNVEIKQDGKYYGALSYYIYIVISTSKLSKDFSWVEKVRSMMKADKRLFRQNMVTETSK